MSADYTDLLAAWRTYPLTVSRSAVITVLVALGFEQTYESSMNEQFAHPSNMTHPVNVPLEDPLMPSTVYEVADAVEEVLG